MANLTVTAANVVASRNSKILYGTAGEALTAGQAVYLDEATKKYRPSDASAEATAKLAGAALNGAAANQPVAVQFGGVLKPGATVVVGEVYVASATAGAIAPLADLAAGEFVSILGVGVAADEIELGIHNSGVAVPA